MLEKILKKVFIFYKYYLIIIPFLAYFGVIFTSPEYCTKLSIFGWLPLAIYYTFFQVKYKLINPKLKEISFKIIPLLILALAQAWINGSLWTFFISAFIYEACTLSIAICLMFVYKIKEAKDLLFVILLAFILLGGASVYTLIILISAINHNFSIVFFLSLGIALIVDIIFELEFIQAVMKRKISHQEIIQGENNLNDHILWFIFAIFMWGLGMPALKELIIRII